MVEWIVSSSVLIAVVILLRFVLKGKLSLRLQYALWAVVLARLLVPVSIGDTAMSVSNLTQKAVASEPVQFVSALSETELPRMTYQAAYNEVAQEYADRGIQIEEMPLEEYAETVDYEIMNKMHSDLSIAKVVKIIWISGIVLVGVWFLISNLRLHRSLKKTRTLLTDRYTLPVYLSNAIDTPCLFGLFHPAIYLTSEAIESEHTQRHAVEHELTHFRHKDNIWAILRSVCLAVHWFNPLVWCAAVLSRNDAELACDESTILRLGEEERASYGRTLIHLTCEKHPALLNTATTMTGSGKSIKERIALIVKKPKMAGYTLAAVILVTVFAVGCTFTGGTEISSDTPNGSETPIAILSAEELAWFSEEFFGAGIYGNGTWDMNIRNQFLSSTYSKPEEINLFELFYCGTGQQHNMAKEELAQVGAFDANGEEICPTTKLSVEGMDAVLTQYLGLTVAQTNKVGLDGFTYLKEYNAYYHSHGDTNYRSGVRIASGERDGNYIRLYYNDVFMGDGWKCVTLLNQGNGSFWFVSNLNCDEPNLFVITIPDEDPWLTIPLEEANPTDPYTFEVEYERVSDDCAKRGYGFALDNDMVLRPYRSTDGNVYAAVVRESVVANGQAAQWEADRFFKYPSGVNVDSCRLEPFTDLFGYSGAIVTYQDYITGGPGQGGLIGTFNDYYAFEEGKNPVFLLRAYEDAQIIDMDGDGENELLSSRQIFFKRDNAVYEINLVDALQTAWPELSYWDFSNININLRCLTVSGMAIVPEWDVDYANAWINRDIYFDGENLLVYRNLPETEDHVSVKVPVNFPDDVYTAAKDRVQTAFDSTKAGAENALSDQSFDDWRISYLSPVTSPFAYPGIALEIYALGYQFHAENPGNVMLAGGTYVQEDGWVGGFYIEDSPYLIFWLREDGTRVLLDSYIAGDVSWESNMFAADLRRTLLKNGVCTPELFDGRALYHMFYSNQYVFLNELAEYEEDIAKAALTRLVNYALLEVPPEDADLFQHGLDNLKWNQSTLTEQGLALYQTLLGLLDT